jgi:hypothetical protein
MITPYFSLHSHTLACNLSRYYSVPEALSVNSWREKPNCVQSDCMDTQSFRRVVKCYNSSDVDDYAMSSYRSFRQGGHLRSFDDFRRMDRTGGDTREIGLIGGRRESHDPESDICQLWKYPESTLFESCTALDFSKLFICQLLIRYQVVAQGQD